MYILHVHLHVYVIIMMIGHPLTIPSKNKILTFPSFAPKQEVSTWLRRGCVENTMSVVVTLTSLADLLQKINNIVDMTFVIPSNLSDHPPLKTDFHLFI